MMLNFGGFVPLSTVDFPGRSSCVVFFRGCSIRCEYCHNKHLWTGESYLEVEKVERMIKDSLFCVSGAVFSGGEPMEQPEVLQELLRYSKEDLGLQTCVHTSGAYDVDLRYVDAILVGNNPNPDGFHPATLYHGTFKREEK